MNTTHQVMAHNPLLHILGALIRMSARPLHNKLSVHTAWSQVWVPVVFLAVVLVVASVAAFVPFMLYGLGLAESEGGGWNAAYAALFASMIASTDAASVVSILKSGE